MSLDLADRVVVVKLPPKAAKWPLVAGGKGPRKARGNNALTISIDVLFRGGEDVRKESGEVLASRVFGWDDGITAWWRDTSLALTSPLAKACRYESQPFWASAEGFRTAAPNPCLARIRLDRFELRARARCAIDTPTPSPSRVLTRWLHGKPE